MQVLKQRQGALFEAHDHHHDDGDHDHGGDEHAAIDGHIWLDPENAKAIVIAVTKALVARYPESAERFKSNASALDAKIAALESDLTTELAPLKGKSFIVFHDAYHYFENRFGLQAVGSITLSPEVQPSAKRLTEVRQKVAGLGAVCVFAEPGFQPALISAVTEGTKAKAGTLDPEGVALQLGSDLYFDLMHNLAHSLVSCLSPGQ